MTSFVCSSAVPVKARTGIPEKREKRNQFYSLVSAYFYLIWSFSLYAGLTS